MLRRAAKSSLSRPGFAGEANQSVGNDESHPLASLMDLLGLLVEKYEDEHIPVLEGSVVFRDDPPQV